MANKKIEVTEEVLRQQIAYAEKEVLRELDTLRAIVRRADKRIINGDNVLNLFNRFCGRDGVDTFEFEMSSADLSKKMFVLKTLISLRDNLPAYDISIEKKK